MIVLWHTNFILFFPFIKNIQVFFERIIHWKNAFFHQTFSLFALLEWWKANGFHFIFYSFLSVSCLRCDFSLHFRVHAHKITFSRLYCLRRLEHNISCDWMHTKYEYKKLWATKERGKKWEQKTRWKNNEMNP